MTMNELRIALVSFSDHGVAMDYLRSLGTSLGRESKVTLWHPVHHGTSDEFQSWDQPPGKCRLLAWHVLSNDVVKLFERIMTLRPHAVHVCYGEGYPAVMKLERICRRNGTVFGITFHDVRPHGGSLVEKAHNMMAMKVAGRADLVHVHCENLGNLLPVDLRSDGRVVVAELPAFECGVCRSAGRQLAQRTTYGDDLVFVGRFERYKGIFELCDGLREYFLAGGTRDVHLVGRGGLAPIVWRLAEAFPRRINVYSDYLPEEQLHDILERSAVCIMPYISGTQSTVPYWAAQHGCHIAATKVGCIADSLVRLGATPLANPTSRAIAECLLRLDTRIPESTVGTLPTFDELGEVLLANYRRRVTEGDAG